MNENLTVQEALAKLLAEKKSLLNDSKALMIALQEHVAPTYSMQLAFFRNALVEANIGEVLILADGSSKDTRDRAKAEVMARLEKNNMPKERAVFVVQTLTEAMGWHQEPPLELPSSHNNDLKFFPVVDNNIQHSQQETQIKTSKSVKTHLDTIDENDKADNKTEGKTAVDYYNDGLIAVREKKYDKALENFNKAIEMNPAYIEAYNKRGMCYYELKKYRNALTDFDRAAQLDPNNESIRRMQTLLHQKLADAEGSKIDDEIDDEPSNKTDNTASSMKITNVMPVAEIFRQAKSQSTTEIATKGMQIILRQKLADAESSKIDDEIDDELGDKTVNTASGRKITNAMSVAEFFRQKKNQTTTGTVTKDSNTAAKVKVKTVFDYYNSALIAMRDGKYNKALEDLNKAIEMNPAHSEAYSKRGMCYYELKQYKNASTDFDRAAQLDPSNESIRRMQMLLHQKMNDQDKYVKLSNKTVISIVVCIIVLFLGVSVYSARNSAREYNSNGLTYQSKQQYDKALVEFNQAIKLYSGYAEAYFNRGMIYCKKKDYPDSLTDLNRAIQLDSQYTEAYFERGMLYCEIKKYDKALDDFDQAIKLNSKYAEILKYSSQYAEAYCGRGMLYCEEGKYDKALDDFDQAIELDSEYAEILKQYPRYAEAYCGRGMSCAKMGQYDKAVTDFNKAIELYPQYSEAYFNRGKAYYGKKEYDNALTDFDKALELNSQYIEILKQDSKYAEAYHNRGKAYYDKEEYDKALTDYNRVIELNPKYAHAYAHRGMTYYMIKQYENAIVDYTKAIDLNLQSDWLYYDRGLAYSNKGDYDAAIADYNKALEINPNYESAKNQLQNLQNYQR